MFPNNSVTCMSAWHSIRIKSDGSVMYCDASIERYSIKDHQYLEWWQSSETAGYVRTSIQKGTEYSGCERCYLNLQNNESTYRSKKNFQAGIHHGEFFKNSLIQSPAYKIMQKTDLKGHLPTTVDLTFSNECNANCIMCSPTDSNQVAQDHYEFGYYKNNISLRWKNFNDSIENALKMIIGNDRLLTLKITGGEPFVQKEVLDFINQIVNAGKTDMAVVIGTNATHWNQELIDQLLKFNNCLVDVSIETYADDNEYIRKGCANDIVRKNIEKFLRLRKNRNVQIYLHPVPQLLSIHNFDTLIDYCNNNKVPMLAQTIFRPEYMRLEVLPMDFRLNILEKWEKKYNISTLFLDQNQDTNFTSPKNFVASDKSQLSNNLKNVLRYLSVVLKYPEPTNVEELRKQLFDHIKKFDLKHNLNFKSTFPFLTDLYTKYNA